MGQTRGTHTPPSLSSHPLWFPLSLLLPPFSSSRSLHLSPSLSLSFSHFLPLSLTSSLSLFLLSLPHFLSVPSLPPSLPLSLSFFPPSLTFSLPSLPHFLSPPLSSLTPSLPLSLSFFPPSLTSSLPLFLPSLPLFLRSLPSPLPHFLFLSFPPPSLPHIQQQFADTHGNIKLVTTYRQHFGWLLTYMTPLLASTNITSSVARRQKTNKHKAAEVSSMHMWAALTISWPPAFTRCHHILGWLRIWQDEIKKM